MNRIGDKINELETYLEELESILPENLEEYKRSIEKRAACERYLEKIVEALIELGFLIAKRERFPLPEGNLIFELLLEKEIIQKELFIKMKNAKGMRNIIAHKYGEVDDEMVFESITQELISDADSFLEILKKYLEKN